MTTRGILDLLLDAGLVDMVGAEAMAWRRKAACLGQGAEGWFAERGEPAEQSKRVCERCPVWQPCLEYALENHIRDGCWGGTTEKERRVILRARRRGQALELTAPRARWGSGSETTREYRRVVADQVRTASLTQACTPMQTESA